MSLLLLAFLTQIFCLISIWTRSSRARKTKRYQYCLGRDSAGVSVLFGDFKPLQNLDHLAAATISTNLGSRTRWNVAEHQCELKIQPTSPKESRALLCILPPRVTSILLHRSVWTPLKSYYINMTAPLVKHPVRNRRASFTRNCVGYVQSHIFSRKVFTKRSVALPRSIKTTSSPELARLACCDYVDCFHRLG